MGKKRRYDIVREGATWTVGVGGPSLRGYLSQDAAIAAAREAARQAHAMGQEIQIFLWNGAEPIEDASDQPQK
ncbi:hypothetical protein [Devosia nitrariae]|uniref:hypothetical protein n=1 Tax=Devosia nitrariae TaxID=2071872 RepID=UPI0024E12533|nr:hypothetical protein [Devosia nitrariae]